MALSRVAFQISEIPGSHHLPKVLLGFVSNSSNWDLCLLRSLLPRNWPLHQSHSHSLGRDFHSKAAASLIGEEFQLRLLVNQPEKINAIIEWRTSQTYFFAFFPLFQLNWNESLFVLIEKRTKSETNAAYSWLTGHVCRPKVHFSVLFSLIFRENKLNELIHQLQKPM